MGPQMPIEPPTDARTTPQFLRIPAVMLLFGLAALFEGAFEQNKDGGAPNWISRCPDLYWMSGWSMFTSRNRTQMMVTADAERAGAWSPVDLGALFPARWESGLRFERDWILASNPMMRAVAEAACGRMAARGERAERVRFNVARWRKRLGTTKQYSKRRRLKEETAIVWTCGDPVTRVPGLFGSALRDAR